jgi:hypothetical protein
MPGPLRRVALYFPDFGYYGGKKNKVYIFLSKNIFLAFFNAKHLEMSLNTLKNP